MPTSLEVNSPSHRSLYRKENVAHKHIKVSGPLDYTRILAFPVTMALKLFKKGEKAEKPEKVPKAPKEPKEKSPKRSMFKRAPKEPKQEETKPDPPKLVEEVSFYTTWY